MAPPLPSPPLSPKGMSPMGEELLIINVVLTAVSLISVVLRITARLIEIHTLHRCDITIILGWVLCLVMACVESGAIFHGGVGWPDEDLPETQLIIFLRLFFCSEITYALLGAVVKYSVLRLYLCIFGRSYPFKVTAYVVMGFSIAWGIANFVAVMVRCAPVKSKLGFTLDVRREITQVDSMKLFWAGGIGNLILDLAILFLPMRMIWGLHLNKKKKMALICIFLTGGVACLGSALRLLSIARLKSDDFTITVSLLGIWTCVEINLAVIAACLPTLRPLLMRVKSPSDCRTSSDTYSSSPSAESKGSAVTASYAMVRPKIYDHYSMDSLETKQEMGERMSNWNSKNEAYCEAQSIELVRGKQDEPAKRTMVGTPATSIEPRLMRASLQFDRLSRSNFVAPFTSPVLESSCCNSVVVTTEIHIAESSLSPRSQNAIMQSRSEQRKSAPCLSTQARPPPRPSANRQST